jgi:hypothetical protein
MRRDPLEDGGKVVKKQSVVFDIDDDLVVGEEPEAVTLTAGPRRIEDYFLPSCGGVPEEKTVASGEEVATVRGPEEGIEVLEGANVTGAELVKRSTIRGAEEQEIQASSFRSVLAGQIGKRENSPIGGKRVDPAVCAGVEGSDYLVGVKVPE